MLVADLDRMMRRVALLAIHQLQSRFGSPCTYIYAYISWYILPILFTPAHIHRLRVSYSDQLSIQHCNNDILEQEPAARGSDDRL